MADSGNALQKAHHRSPFMLLLSYRFQFDFVTCHHGAGDDESINYRVLAETGKSFGKWPCHPINSAQDALQQLEYFKITIQKSTL